MFLCDVAGLVSEEAVRRRAGESGGLPGVETLERGDGPDGVYSALASVRLEAPAYDVFRRLCDPEENKRIFDRTCASVNYRHILEEDPEEQSRLIEVSKTGRWRILGIPVHFESTVFAVEDWKSLEIRFRIKSSGTMQHFSGFWKMCPLRQNETVVLFYQEAVPSIPMPKLFRAFLQSVVRTLCGSLLEDLRDASGTWGTRPVPDSGPPLGGGPRPEEDLRSLEQLLQGLRAQWPEAVAGARPAAGAAPALAEAPAEDCGTVEAGAPKRQRQEAAAPAEPLSALTSQQLRERSQQTLGARQELARSICALVREDGDGRLALRADPGRCVRDVVRYCSGDAEIPAELQRRLLQELRSLPWPKKRHRAKAVVAERYLVIWRDPGPRPGHEQLFELLLELAALAAGDPWTHVAVTKNFQGSPHRDEQDATWQRVISLGDFVGGELCVEGPLEGHDGPLRRLYVVSTRNRLTRVDGRFPHFVRQREGDRFSLVYYCLDAGEFREPTRPLELPGDAAAGPD